MPVVELKPTQAVAVSTMKALRELERTSTLMMDVPVMLDRRNRIMVKEVGRRVKAHLRAVDQARMVIMWMGHDDAAYGPKDCEEKSEVKVEVCPECNGIPNENCQCGECRFLREARGVKR